MGAYQKEPISSKERKKLEDFQDAVMDVRKAITNGADSDELAATFPPLFEADEQLQKISGLSLSTSLTRADEVRKLSDELRTYSGLELSAFDERGDHSSPAAGMEAHEYVRERFLET